MTNWSFSAELAGLVGISLVLNVKYCVDGTCWGRLLTETLPLKFVVRFFCSDCWLRRKVQTDYSYQAESNFLYSQGQAGWHKMWRAVAFFLLVYFCWCVSGK